MPPIDIEILEDRSSQTPSDQGFIRVRRLVFRTLYENGTQSEPYKYDVTDRDAIDAVLVVLHARRTGTDTDPYVCMRTALRPPLALRRNRPIPLPVPDARPGVMLWELPAGLIEPGAIGEAAVMDTAARETEEETGYSVPASAFTRLGPPTYLSPGFVAEKLHIVHAEIDRHQPAQVTATEEVEKASWLEWWPLSDALERAASGEIEDCKTELGLHRLRAYLLSRVAPFGTR